MADETQKLIIEIDADPRNFQAGSNAVTGQLKSMSTEGTRGFSDMSLAFLGLNQALELGEKLLEGVSAALETINKSEAIDNQKIALQALGAEVGLSADQLKILTSTIQKASGDTLTSVQATDAAFKLLNAGFKAETIPGLIEFAKRAEETRHVPMEQGIQDLTRSMEALTTRGLKEMGIEVVKTGDRQAILNAILEQSQAYINKTGDGYESFGKRVGASMTESKEKTEAFFGAGLRQVGIGLIGTDAEKASLHLKDLTGQMAAVDAAAKAGRDSIMMFVEGTGGEPAMNRTISLTDARAKLIPQITAAQNQLNAATMHEGQIIDDNKAKLAGGKDLPTITDAVTAANAKALNQKKLYEQLYSDDVTYAQNADLITKNLEAAKRAEIEKTFQKEVSDDQGKLLKKGEFAKLEMQHEVDKFNALRNLADSHNAVTTQHLRDGWLQATAEMAKSTTNFTNLVKSTTLGMEGVVSNSFIAMAKAHKWSVDQMLQNMLGFIGEAMIKDGTLKLFQGAWPPNPGLLGIGAAEIAAGSVLVGIGGDTSSATAPTMAGAIGNDVSGQNQLAGGASQTPQKGATIYINGDFLASSETANRLQEIIRKNSDITNYAIVPQGGSW